MTPARRAGSILCVAGLGLALWASQLTYDLERRLFLARGSGYIAISLLILTLSMTPLSRLTAHVAADRRALGLCTAIAAGVHLGFAIVLDDSITRLPIAFEPHLLTGFVSLVILAMLAVTSYPRVVRALHLQLWKPLHRMVYGALVLAVLHVAHSAFARRQVVLVLAGVTVGLLAIRIVMARSRHARAVAPAVRFEVSLRRRGPAETLSRDGEDARLST